MVKHPDNAIAEVDVFMLDGRFAFNVHVLVKDLRDFWSRHKHEIRWICFDIGLTMYFWSKSKGWQQMSRYHYNGGTKPATVKNRTDFLASFGINVL